MLSILLLAAAAAIAPKPAELELFRDWTVGCDNGLYCQAVALMPEDWPEDGATMVVERGPEAGAAPKISFSLGEAGRAAGLEADGQRLAVRLAGGDAGAEVAAGDVPKLLAALRAAKRLRILGADGAPIGTVTLAGASAALLYMDDRQKRVGTVTALVRPGGKPASAVPPPPPVPVVNAPPLTSAPAIAVGAARIAALRKQYGCTIDEVGGPDDVETVALEPGKTLLLLACGSGAYNVSVVPLIVQRRGRDLRFDYAAFDPRIEYWDDGKPILINAGWDSSKGVLGSFSKARGLGDCGISADYAWDGTRFRLVEQTEMGECRGSIDYIRTWQARVVRR